METIVADWVEIGKGGAVVRLEGPAVRSWLEDARQGTHHE